MPSSPPSVGAGPTISFSPHNTLQVGAPFASTSSDGGPGPGEVARHLQEPSWRAAKHRSELERRLVLQGLGWAVLRVAAEGAALWQLSPAEPVLAGLRPKSELF